MQVRQAVKGGKVVSLLGLSILSVLGLGRGRFLLGMEEKEAKKQQEASSRLLVRDLELGNL
jgi:hypothetical protein